jgi:adenylylsulfate kinase
MERKSSNVFWQDGLVKRDERERRYGNRAAILWMTGLPSSGKTTLAIALERELTRLGFPCYRLDGDNVRHGLNSDLGFSPADRDENIRRIGEVAKLFMDAGILAVTSFISPYRQERDRVRASVGDPRDFIEVHVDCALEECERRDPKGLYAKARAGKLPEFTGVSAPYEAPLTPEIHLRTDLMNVKSCVNCLVEYLTAWGYLEDRVDEGAKGRMIPAQP